MCVTRIVCLAFLHDLEGEIRYQERNTGVTVQKKEKKYFFVFLTYTVPKEGEKTLSAPNTYFFSGTRAFVG